jgi:hypothetical protein
MSEIPLCRRAMPPEDLDLAIETTFRLRVQGYLAHEKTPSP